MTQTLILLEILFVVCAGTACFFFYRAGKLNERANHYNWMAEGWKIAADHVDFIRITQPPQNEALQQHIECLMDAFGMNRPYPPEKEEQ